MHLTADIFSVAPASAIVIGVVALLAGIATRSAATHLLPVARTVTPPGQDAASTPEARRERRFWAPRILRRLRAPRLAPIPATHVAGWSDALSRCLRAGDVLRTALEHELPDDRALRTRTDPIRKALGHGIAVSEAMTAVSVRDGDGDGDGNGNGDGEAGAAASNSAAARDPHLELLCSVIAATADFGGSAAAPIDRVGATLRLRSADGQERDAQSAQARLSAHVLTVVPLAVLALLAATDADVRRFSTGGLGLIVIGCGLALNLAGWSWMKRVVTGEAS